MVSNEIHGSHCSVANMQAPPPTSSSPIAPCTPLEIGADQLRNSICKPWRRVDVDL